MKRNKRQLSCHFTSLIDNVIMQVLFSVAIIVNSSGTLISGEGDYKAASWSSNLLLFPVVCIYTTQNGEEEKKEKI